MAVAGSRETHKDVIENGRRNPDALQSYPRVARGSNRKKGLPTPGDHRIVVRPRVRQL
jgi:hypothetical protein